MANCSSIESVLTNEAAFDFDDRHSRAVRYLSVCFAVDIEDFEPGPAPQEWRDFLDELLTQMAAGPAVDLNATHCVQK